VSQLALLGYGLAAAAFTILFLLLLTGWRARFQGKQLLIAVGGSLLWSLAAAAQAGFGLPGIDIVWAAEVLRNLLWVLFLLHLLRPFAQGKGAYLRLLNSVRVASLLLGLLMLAMLVDIPQVISHLRPGEVQREFSLIG